MATTTHGEHGPTSRSEARSIRELEGILRDPGASMAEKGGARNELGMERNKLIAAGDLAGAKKLKVTIDESYRR